MVKSNATAGSSSKRRCVSCSERHVKCEYDEQSEKCRACQAGDRSCLVKCRIKHFTPGKKAKKRRPSLQSSQLVSSKISADTVVQSQTQSDSTISVISPISLHNQPFSNSRRDYTLHEALAASPVLFNASPQEGSTFRSTAFIQAAFCETPASVAGAASTSNPSPQSILLGHDQLSDKEIAIFLRHFTNVLSRWFDVCDPKEHFRRVVPGRALKCATLMKAICALSAWHLCRQGKFELERSNFLYENCLAHLIKAMESPLVGSDDSILVAAVILHLLEELREQTLRLDSRGHIAGIRIFIDPGTSTQDSDHELREAAFRVAVREDLSIAVINQQPLTLPPELCALDRTLSPAHDDDWAMRIILHTRDAVAFLIEPGDTRVWDELVEYCQQWDLLKPESFSPTFCAERDEQVGRVLPEIWYLHDCHVIGVIHYHFCSIVLEISNPRTPRLGWHRNAAANRIDEEVKSRVIDICGIAQSNSLLPSALIAAVMVIVMCAERFTEPSVQLALQNILIQARDLYAWPTEAALSYTQSLWVT